jgi:hypothetical protein
MSQWKQSLCKKLLRHAPNCNNANLPELRMRGSYPVSARKKMRGRLVTYQHSEKQ